MDEKTREKKLRDKRFYKKQLRKKYHIYNLRSFKRRREYFEATFSRSKIVYLEQAAPKTFSLLENRDETIAYFNKIDALLRHGTRTHMNFSQIEYTDMPTVCTLSAYMVDSRPPARFLQVSIPKANRPQFKIWAEAQFENTILRDRELNYGSGGFLSRSGHEINTELVGDILNSTIDYFGHDKRQALNNLSAVINEIVENTTLHADAEGFVGNLRWLINTRTQSNGNTKVKEYCLIDLGVGVYDSIKANVIRWNTKSSSIVHRLSGILDEGQQQNVFLSKNIPKGVGSRTNQATRGKGIKHIYETVQNPVYQQFDIITNKAHVHLKDLSTINSDSTESFFGTIYYWKIGFNE